MMLFVLVIGVVVVGWMLADKVLDGRRL